MIRKGNTKQRIIEESMKLFSVHGFEAVSIRTIAEAVGVGNSALYKHFKSKQDILEAIVLFSKEYFQEKSSQQMTQIQGKEDLKKACITMFAFQTQDEWMVMFRKLLLIEQFKNQEMAEIYRKFYIELPVESQTMLFEQLICAGVMTDRNARVMAMELYAPFYLYHLHAESIEQLENLFLQHVDNFWESYFANEKE